MGRIKEWNELFERMTLTEDFEAVMAEDFASVATEPSDMENDEAVYIRRYALLERIPEVKSGGMSAEKRKREVFASEDFVNMSVEQISFASEKIEELTEEFEAIKEHYGFEGYREDTVFAENGQKMRETYEEERQKERLLGKKDIDWSEEEFFEGSDMRLTEERTGQILDYAQKTAAESKKHEIRIEMVNDTKRTEDALMDEMLEEMTARLCAMMAKGTDGIY